MASPADHIGDQIGGVWRGMMGAMTAQGATREQIAQVSAATAFQILALTGQALWPGVFLYDPRHATPGWPAGESMHGLALEDAARVLLAYLEELQENQEAAQAVDATAVEEGSPQGEEEGRTDPE